MKFEINLNSVNKTLLMKEKLEKRVAMHSFHRYYGKLIPAIPSTFIKKYTSENDLVFDPFVGSGTTAVEALKLNRNFYGIEINPLSSLISATKTSKLDVFLLNEYNQKLMNIIKENEYDIDDLDYPFLVNRMHWFKEYVQNDLLVIKKSIDDFFNSEEIPNCSEYKNFYIMTLSAILRNVSNADTRHVFPGISKRMRALELEGKHNPNVIVAFERAIKKRASYYTIYQNIKSNAIILNGNSVDVDLSEIRNSVDLIVTNPPYISSVRYIETLKLELYWLNFIQKYHEYSELASKMLGNDKILKKEYEKLEFTVYDEINELIENMEKIDRKSAKILGTFFNQIEQVIVQMHFVLKPGKKAIIKISDSKVKKCLIETGKYMTIIAENNGFRLVDVFLDEINQNSRSLTTARNSYSDIITHDYIIVWEKI